MTGHRYGPDGASAPVRIRNLGINLRLLRLRRNMTRPELAERVGCEPNRIRYTEIGTHEPRFFLVMDLALALDARIEDLLADPPPDWEDQVSDMEHGLRSARIASARGGWFDPTVPAPQGRFGGWRNDES